MAEMLDAESLTRSSTQFEPLPFSAGWLANFVYHEELRIRNNDKGWHSVKPDIAFVGPYKNMVIELKSGDVIVRDSATSLASSFKDVGWLPSYRQFPHLSSAAESPTATTERSWPQLRRRRRRHELLRQLTPERRATYERIKKLREDVGPLDFDVVEELRDLRENG